MSATAMAPRRDEAVHRAYYRQTIALAAEYLRDRGMSDWPIVLERDLDRFVPAMPDSLDAAWAEAQAACAERGLFLEELAAFNRDGLWQASAWLAKGDTPHTTATAVGPAAALHLLAARLRETS